MAGEMDDVDFVMVSGIISENPDYQDNIPNGRKALNFIVESRKTIKGKPMFFKHQVTAWDMIAESNVSRLVNGAYVRVEGHLQASTVNFIDPVSGAPKTVYCDRVNAKRIFFED